jgi:thiol-disulfide isomerase/thioredoxin
MIKSFSKLSFLLPFLFSSFLFSCASNQDAKVNENEDNLEQNLNKLPDNFEIRGSIYGAANQPLSLEAVSNQGTIRIAETSVKQDGSFILIGNIKGFGIYQLKLGFADNKVIPLTLEPKDKVELTASYEKFELLPVWKGTIWSEPLTLYMNKFNNFAIKQMELSQQKDLTQDQQMKEFLKIRKSLDDFASEQMFKDPSNPANIVLSTSLTPAMGFEFWNEDFLLVLKKVADSYSEKYKESPIVLSMQNQVKQIEAGFNEFMLTKSGKKEAPEIALKNPDGKVIKLTSLRGKVVLIDFWASWCGPCRKENPNVVKMYEKYKNKGFTVYSVSLDKDSEAWKRAIKSDSLSWPNHVSDLLQWDTPLTQVYGFNSIPYTVLVNKEGKIIGTNLRGESLEQKLKEVL